MPLAGSAHHAIYWRRRPPEGRAKRPTALQAARSRIETALLERRGALWHAFAELAPVFRTGEDGKPAVAERRRRLRKDAAVNMASLLNVILSCTDLASGLVTAVNQPGAPRWQSKSWADLAGFAYGELIADEVSTRRAERHARMLQAMGLIRSVQWFVYDSATRTVRSPASKKFVTAKLWELLGVAQAIKAHRRSRDRERNKARLDRVAGLQQARRPGQRADRPAVAAAPAAEQRPNAGAYGYKPKPPRAPPSPAAEAAAQTAIAALKKLLR